MGLDCWCWWDLKWWLLFLFGWFGGFSSCGLGFICGVGGVEIVRVIGIDSVFLEGEGF